VFLEQHTFAGRTADFAWMMMLGALALLPLPLIVPSLGLPFYAGSLVFALLYLWSRENPDANTSIMGMVKMKAFYLPWGMMALEALMGGSVVPDLLGVVVGHLYYFLTVLQPRAGGPRLVKTPNFVSRLCASAFGAAPAPGTADAPRAPTRNAAWGRGRGRRLGSE
jgi:Derlin-2/3